jgi:hypothetical protein
MGNMRNASRNRSLRLAATTWQQVFVELCFCLSGCWLQWVCPFRPLPPPAPIRTDVGHLDIKAFMVDDLAGWESACYRWLSPAELHLRGAPTDSQVALAEPLRPILETAARSAFWKLAMTTLHTICEKVGSALPRQRTLLEYIKALVLHALPTLSDEELVAILAQRCPRVDPLMDFFQSPDAAGFIEAMHPDDQKQVDKVKTELAKDTQSKEGYAKEYMTLVSQVRSRPSRGSGRGKQTGQSEAEKLLLKRGPMFTSRTSATDVALYLPPLYRVREDTFNGRWEVTHKHRYLVSLSWMRWGFAEGALKACETCWADYHKLGGQPCPWLVAAFAASIGSSGAASSSAAGSQGAPQPKRKRSAQ